jgi:hypothetical protein
VAEQQDARHSADDFGDVADLFGGERGENA